jgi:Protein of unknown function (DUF1592)/Protein of unknown function (DUF1588)/Protein of unknown function (DUF1587)/Protein of unknown function (DUF1585)/Protein of unknown function (DUF1595)/Cytochrome C oxidase, cbb3-type, subunit III
MKLPRFALGLIIGFAGMSIAIDCDTPAVAADPPRIEKKWQPDDPGYQKTIDPFLKEYCASCHTGSKAKGTFRSDTGAVNNFLDLAVRETWSDIVNVLNGHEMPPKKAKQPTSAEVAAVVDWITAQSVRAEMIRRDRAVVLRRMNREEYRNTIRDLIGVDFDTSLFPQDPPAGGFDNNGSALTMSPLQVELYITAARQILDRALVEGERPRTIKWRFEPKNTPMDSVRKRLDAANNPVVNGGANSMEGNFVVIHYDRWDRGLGARGFKVPLEGTYAIRIHAGGRVPSRQQVVESATKILKKRQNEQEVQNPRYKQANESQFQRDLAHFQTDRMYDYGPPRIKLTLQLGSQPRVIDEFDVDATADAPKVYEYRTYFTTESAGVSFQYAYSIPYFVENFWFQGRDEFARPELLIDWFEIEGPLYESWRPPSHTAILFPPTVRMSEQQYAREILSRFMRKAYRRPVTAAEIDAKMKLFDLARQYKKPLESIKLPLTAILSSPNFLYLVEPTGDSADGPTALDDFELASRLSYFLWSSTPDDRLAELAEKGGLKDRATRLKEVDRMLADPKALALVENFAAQWLGLREIGTNPPAGDLYPRYDRHLELSIARESAAFFREILFKDRDARELVKSDYVVINERLARFYGIPGVKGDHFRKVAVPAGVRRGGIPTQASILSLTSNGTRTTPVKRGAWILNNLLGTDPGLPVSNIGEIAPKVPGIDKATVRKRLEIHRELPQCARCHNKIDPLGFALENFNASGEWRDQEGFGYKGRIEKNDPKIDASSVMPDGRPINGVEGLQQAILAKEDLFLGCLSSKLFTYALGRELGLADQSTVKKAIAELKHNGYTLRSLIKFIVTSEHFEIK